MVNMAKHYDDWLTYWQAFHALTIFSPIRRSSFALKLCTNISQALSKLLVGEILIENLTLE